MLIIVAMVVLAVLAVICLVLACALVGWMRAPHDDGGFEDWFTDIADDGVLDREAEPDAL